MPKIERKLFIGLDPGKSGGIGFIWSGGGHPNAVSMPATERDIWDILRCARNDGNGGQIQSVHCIIERLWGYVGGRNSAPAMFGMGANYGSLRMALIAAGIPFDEVIPRTWQAAMGVAPRKKTESDTQFKNRLKAKAQQLFPAVKVTLAVCDALLIAEYCRRINK